MKKERTLESWMIKNGKKNAVFFTKKLDKDMTAIASYYQRKIITERVILTEGEWTKPKSYALTKVTLQ